MVLETELAARLSLGAMDEGEMGVVAELRSRHGHSAQPESQQVLAVLTAVLEVIAAEGLQPTPTALFAAVMSALEREDTRSSPQVSAGAAAAAACRRLPPAAARRGTWLQGHQHMPSAFLAFSMHRSRVLP